MFQRIHNEPRDYAWGSAAEISTLLGLPKTVTPEAELWLGAHPGSPARLGAHPSAHPGSPTGLGAQEGPAEDANHEDAPAAVAHGERLDEAAPRHRARQTLAELIEADPEHTLGPRARSLHADGRGDGNGNDNGNADDHPDDDGYTSAAARLPFLMKVLAAAAPLSLQVHPTLEQARAGFAAEDARGIDRDAPHRNYKDPLHKPELLLALSPEFHALSGFREVTATQRLMEIIDAPKLRAIVGELSTEADLERAFAALLELEPAELEAVLAEVVARVAEVERERPHPLVHRELATFTALASAYPGDAGALVALLLNRVTLRRGEAIFLPAGNLHAYLSGTGIEVMAASDNVLRGGLTPKHVDVPELKRITEVRSLPVPVLEPHERAGLLEFAPDVPDFRLLAYGLAPRSEGHRAAEDAHAETSHSDPAERRIALERDCAQQPGAHGESADETTATSAAARLALDGPAIALCTAGSATLTGALGSQRLTRGECVFVTPDERELRIEGDAELFIATTNADAVASGLASDGGPRSSGEPVASGPGPGDPGDSHGTAAHPTGHRA